MARALWQHPQKTMVFTQPSAASTKGAQQKQSKRAADMPQLQGWLCDRCDRGVTSRLRCALQGGSHHTKMPGQVWCLANCCCSRPHPIAGTTTAAPLTAS